MRDMQQNDAKKREKLRSKDAIADAAGAVASMHVSIASLRAVHQKHLEDAYLLRLLL